MSESYWASDYISISQALYTKLDEIAQKRFGYTGQGIINDLVEEILQEYVDKNRVRFQVTQKGLSYYEVVALKEKDKEDDFVGEFEGLTSREALLRVAKDGYGISEDEIEFVN